MQLAQIAGSLIPFAFYFAPLGFVIGSVWVAQRFYKRKDRRNPLTGDLLRAPGHTLKDELDEAKNSLAAYMAAAIPVLNQLVRIGFHVFHDVSCDSSFNIDHVVVGSSGVFAVETKGRAKPLKNGKPEHIVELRDDRLIFPRWTELEPIAQAIRNAQWLSKWLSSATGERVEVHPALALPGWYIDRKTKSRVFVFNAKNSANTLGRWRPSSISSQSIERIVHQLDAKCRDVSRSAR